MIVVATKRLGNVSVTSTVDAMPSKAINAKSLFFLTAAMTRSINEI